MAGYGSSLNEFGYSTAANRDEEYNQERLIFPVNVQESIRAAGGLKRGEKVGIIISFWIFACAIIGWIVSGWLMSVMPQYTLLLTVLLELVLQMTVGVYILRFAMDENSLMNEMNNQNLSFTNYFKIYRDIKAQDGSRYPFDMIEFDDGSYGVFIECRLGHNTQLRSNNTYYANKSVFDALNRSGLPYRVYYHNEDFKTSDAADQIVGVLKGIKDPNLFSAYREIVQNYLDIADNESNVMCATYLVFAQTRIQKDDLVSVINEVFLALEKDETMYRQVSALNYDEIVEFLRREYRLEVLDMGAIRAYIAEKKNRFSCPVKVLKIYGRSGKIYANNDFNSLNRDILSESGLQKAAKS